MLFLMQHYSVPTRLLDWTEDALAALLFAVDTSGSEAEAGIEENPVVWCLNPVKLNETYKLHDLYPPGYIPNADEQKVYQLFGAQEGSCSNKKPCAIYAPLNNARIIAQKGVFTVFPFNNELSAFENLPDSADYLAKIIVDGRARGAICEELQRYGVTKTYLMQEISSVAEEIKKQDFWQ
jgi:hypothetical protein